MILRGDEEMDIDGARVALVVKDVATDLRYVYPAARRSTRECIAAFKHFTKSTDEVGVFYREKGYLPELWYSAQVARPVGQKEIRSTPDAPRSLDVEWVKLVA